ncbi:MAG: beta-N-acetylhexosaminidase [Pseudomonadales bacterium]|nr:beta-N-acetylhexosaminidase [Pseudomonadales bacterium]
MKVDYLSRILRPRFSVWSPAKTFFLFRCHLLGMLVLSILLLNAATGLADDNSQGATLIPAPRSLQVKEGRFILTAKMGVTLAPQLGGGLDLVRLLLGPATGFDFSRVDGGAGMRIGYDATLHEEGYRLEIGTGGVDISASTNAGVHYALQTVKQLLPVEIYSRGLVEQDWVLPALLIDDQPRFSWRGLHLDVGRHFMPVEFIKKYIDLLAVHKMNRFHWHLTEDQGWRIEIKRYPRLTTVGSVRAQTVVGHPLFQDEDEKVFDGTAHGGFYTQEQVKGVVDYAAARHVTVVPEIEFPGHAQAAIAAYPELGNTGEQLKVMEDWGISKNTLKPSDETLDFYRNVLTEVMVLFPSPYIHIGGDEAPKDQWEGSPFGQQRMEQLGLTDANELQSWLIQQMDDFLTANGRRLIGWDEIMQGGLSSNATVMSWRGMERGMQAAEAGHDVIMAPTQWTYFDYYQADPDVEPLAIGSYTPLAQVYHFEPKPAGPPSEVRQRILGAQGQLWTEFMKTPEHVEYMAYPRAAALAEVVWSPRKNRNYDNFLQRLPGHMQRLDVLDVNYRPPGNDKLDAWDSFKQWLFDIAIGIYFWFSDL